MAGPSDAPLQHVEVNGASLAYKMAGNSGPLFITLHGGRGFGTHAGDFRAYHALSSHYRVLSFDMRGHGQSSLTPPYTFAQIVDDIEALRRHFAGDDDDAPAVICGGSFGSFLAQQYALTYPRGVSHLILRGAAPSHEQAEAMVILAQRMARAPMASPGMLRKVFGAFKDDTEMRLVMFALGPLYAEGPYDADAGLESSRTSVCRAETHNALYSDAEKYFDYRPRLHEITCPTLIVAGEFDWICPPSQSRIIHEGVAGSELLIVPGANHSVHLEKNAEVVAAIRQFLRLE